MAKEQGISSEGIVTEERGNGFFTVQLPNGHEVIARIKGKMERKNPIKVLIDDRVIVEMSPYDLSKGFITYRYR